MTQQAQDTLYWNHKKLLLYTEPLEPWMKERGVKSFRFPIPELRGFYSQVVMSTANWRGYVAEWEIKNEEFMLKSISVLGNVFTSCTAQGEPWRNLFSSSSANICAEWFSGDVQAAELSEFGVLPELAVEAETHDGHKGNRDFDVIEFSILRGRVKRIAHLRRERIWKPYWGIRSKPYFER